MKLVACISVVSLSLGLTGCIKEQNYAQVLSAGLSVLQAATLKESEVKKTAQLSAFEMDKKSNVAPATSKYAKRLAKITKNLSQVDGIKLNYKVYLNKQLNAFAMPDGTVRVYSGLLDAMSDDQVLAVVGHEIGHVKLKHSYKQMKKEMLTGAAFQVAGATTGAVGDLSSSQLGALAYKAVNAKFSQSDELQADKYALGFLKKQGKQPSAMLEVIYAFQKEHGSSASFLSSHPSNKQRIDAIKKAL
ncbi:MAG: M48 family metallopeptidase [Oceanospirillaceae bacterium]|nr:M48 family metallopeptidase [Oceanospirillaceae bacterium]